MVYCVGLTGGLASGKSTVATLFAHLGVAIINADHISKELTMKEQAAYYKIVEHYGTNILNESQEINRSALRSIIFANPEERKWLEHLLHPLIRQQIQERVLECTAPYCIVEIPLLIDKKNYPYVQRILLVTAPLELQITRVMARDQCSKKEALAILAAQPKLSQRMNNADDVLVNDQDLNELKATVQNLHQQYMYHSTQPSK